MDALSNEAHIPELTPGRHPEECHIKQALLETKPLLNTGPLCFQNQGLSASVLALRTLVQSHLGAYS